MKTTDLRLGNFISINFGNCDDGKIITVDGISDCEIYNEEHGYSPCNEFNPIPLTEQWLLDFGFKICTKSGVHNGWGIGENPLTHDYFLFLAWMKNEDGTLAELFYRNGYHTIKYVHQLQNLFFALAQEELILKERSKE